MDQETLRKILRYDSNTGYFYWIESRHLIEEGQRAEIDRGDGYLSIYYEGRYHRAHRLAWIYIHGEISARVLIDHINCIRSDNRIENLRLCSRKENPQNARAPRSHNKTGFLGVSLDKSSGKYVASIHANGKKRTIGRYATPEEASAAYLAAKRELHPFYVPYL